MNRKGAIETSAANLGEDFEASSISCKMELSLIAKLSGLLDQAFAQAEELSSKLDAAVSIKDGLEAATYYRDVILPAMQALRESCDTMEVYTPSDVWPFPTYGALLFSVD